MGIIASQITSLTSVYSTVYSGADQRKHQSSASPAFVWVIHRGWPVTRKIFPFDDVIMCQTNIRVSLMLPSTWHRGPGLRYNFIIVSAYHIVVMLPLCLVILSYLVLSYPILSKPYITTLSGYLVLLARWPQLLVPKVCLWDSAPRGSKLTSIPWSNSLKIGIYPVTSVGRHVLMSQRCKNIFYMAAPGVSSPV